MRMADFFLGRIFVTIGDKDELKMSLRQKFYKYQYKIIKDWAQKFDFIMGKAEICRMAERYQNIYGTRGKTEISKDDRKEYCETGKTANKNLEVICQDINWIGRSELYRALVLLFQKEKQSDIVAENVTEDGQEESIKLEEDCSAKCLELVTAVSKHSLQKTSKEDFKYIMNYALEELEMIKEEVEKRKMEEFYYKEVGRDNSDFKILYQVREQMGTVEEENKKYRMLDYI